MSITYRLLASHQFKSHSSSIQALTHTERRVSRIEVNSHWSVRFFRSDYLWEIIIIQISLLLLLSKSHCCYSYQSALSNFQSRSFFRLYSSICISFDSINTISFDLIESKCQKNNSRIESKCQKNNSRKDRFLKHSRDNSRDNFHSRDHDQLLSKNVHHHLLSS